MDKSSGGCFFDSQCSDCLKTLPCSPTVSWHTKHTPTLTAHLCIPGTGSDVERRGDHGIWPIILAKNHCQVCSTAQKELSLSLSTAISHVSTHFTSFVKLNWTGKQLNVYYPFRFVNTKRVTFTTDMHYSMQQSFPTVSILAKSTFNGLIVTFRPVCIRL